MYADDTHLTFAGSNVEQKLNQDLISVSNWLIANKLTLNKSKTEFMVIGQDKDWVRLTGLHLLKSTMFQ